MGQTTCERHPVLSGHIVDLLYYLTDVDCMVLSHPRLT